MWVEKFLVTLALLSLAYLGWTFASSLLTDPAPRVHVVNIDQGDRFITRDAFDAILEESGPGVEAAGAWRPIR